MYLKRWITAHCSECASPVKVLFSFRHPYPMRGWKLADVYYIQCTGCGKMFVGEYSEGKISGCCWSRSPIDRVHQLEGFIGQAYWRFHTEEAVDEPID